MEWRKQCSGETWKNPKILFQINLVAYSNRKLRLHYQQIAFIGRYKINMKRQQFWGNLFKISLKFYDALNGRVRSSQVKVGGRHAQVIPAQAQPTRRQTTRLGSNDPTPSDAVERRRFEIGPFFIKTKE